jgi:hypothetical protein
MHKYQRFVASTIHNSAANKLADFLSDMLNNMQMQMSGVGSGKPKPVKGHAIARYY